MGNEKGKVEDKTNLQTVSEQLLMLPFAMKTMGHKTIIGHARYIHGSPMYRAYLDWMGNQSEENWESLISAWGGEEVFTKVQRHQLEQVSRIIT